MNKLIELVKIRVVDVLVDANTPPWVIDNVIDVIESTLTEGAEE